MESEDALRSFIGMSQEEMAGEVLDENYYEKLKENISNLLKKGEVSTKSSLSVSNLSTESTHTALITSQEKLAAVMKQLSAAQLEIAELKRSISVQEAENASLTIKNLALQQQIGEAGISKTMKFATETNLHNRVRDLEKQVLEANNRVKSLNDANQSLNDRLRASADQKKDREYRNRVTLMDEYKKKLEESEEKIRTLEFLQKERSYMPKQVLSDLKLRSERFMRKIDLFRVKIQQKTEDMDRIIGDLCGKAQVLEDIQHNIILERRQAPRLLGAALHAIVTTSGAENIAFPDPEQCLSSPVIMTEFLQKIRSMDESRARENTRDPSFSTSLSTMNGLLKAMGEQMKYEHEQVMGALRSKELGA